MTDRVVPIALFKSSTKEGVRFLDCVTALFPRMDASPSPPPQHQARQIKNIKEAADTALMREAWLPCLGQTTQKSTPIKTGADPRS